MVLAGNRNLLNLNIEFWFQIQMSKKIEILMKMHLH